MEATGFYTKICLRGTMEEGPAQAMTQAEGDDKDLREDVCGDEDEEEDSDIEV